MAEVVRIRCRNPKCDKKEEEDGQFKKCGRCGLAKYCSRECQVSDWPIHKTMCFTDRQIIQPDGTIVSADIARQQAKDQATQISKTVSMTGVSKADIAKAQDDVVFLPHWEFTDEHVIISTIERLQFQTSLFVVDQYQKTHEKGFLFMQTEHTVEDYRRVTRSGLDRAFICMYMTLKEFILEVLKEHPNPKIKQKAFLQDLKQKINDCNPEESVITVAIFGDGVVHTLESDIPWAECVESLQADPSMFQDQDTIEIHIDT